MDGPLLSIRRFGTDKLMPADLVRKKSASPGMMTLLEAAVKARLNIVIVGGTGSGKTTLLKLILGEITPTAGEVVLGTRLQLAYFDQHRRILDPEKTVRENLSDSDYVSVQGRSRHVIGYLKDFLFPPQRIDSPVKALSGGERNRLLLAKIFTQPANLIVLDEPTNDLDLETLDLLQEMLGDYAGTILLVSHDRYLIDELATQIWEIDPDESHLSVFNGTYSQMKEERKREEERVAMQQSPILQSPASPNPRRSQNVKLKEERRKNATQSLTR